MACCRTRAASSGSVFRYDLNASVSELAASSGSLRFEVWMTAARSKACPASLPGCEQRYPRQGMERNYEKEENGTRQTLLLHSERIRCLRVQIRRILVLFGPSAEEAESPASALRGFVCLWRYERREARKT